MMRKIIILLFLGLISACTNDRSDLELYITTTKAQHVAHIPPLKETPKFEHYAYQAELLRSPFVPPSRELTEEVIEPKKNCLQPDLQRRKNQLETYALDNLKMRGTISQGKANWALIETNDGAVFRVGKGQYLGLYHGRITNVTEQRIDIVELVPDGSGCWTERVSNLELTGN